MTRTFTLSCAVCAKPMAGNKGSLPQGQARCQPCRVAARPAPKPKRIPGTGKSWRDCEVCGDRYRAKQKAQRACGRQCGQELQARMRPVKTPPSCPVEWSNCRVCGAWLAKSGRVLCGADCRREDSRRKFAAQFVSQAKPTTRPCADCGEDYTTPTASNGGVCKRCQRRRAKVRFGSSDRMRARYHGVQYERIDRLRVYERDGWRCGLCGKAVRRDVTAPHPLSPSLDHVVPMARGGDHLYANVQCAHFLCNSTKGDRGGQQLTLIG